MPGVYVGQRDFYIAIDAPADGTVNRGGNAMAARQEGRACRIAIRSGAKGRDVDRKV